MWPICQLGRGWIHAHGSRHLLGSMSRRPELEFVPIETDRSDDGDPRTAATTTLANQTVDAGI